MWANGRCPLVQRQRTYASRRRCLWPLQPIDGGHLRSGCLAAGPLLLPGRPLMFEVSCCWTVGFCWVCEDPTVSPGLAAGPFLFPGWPAIPDPELWELGAAETSGLVVWAAAEPDTASATARVIHLMASSSWAGLLEAHVRASSQANVGQPWGFLAVRASERLSIWLRIPMVSPKHSDFNRPGFRFDLARARGVLADLPWHHLRGPVNPEPKPMIWFSSAGYGHVVNAAGVVQAKRYVHSVLVHALRAACWCGASFRRSATAGGRS